MNDKIWVDSRDGQSKIGVKLYDLKNYLFAKNALASSLWIIISLYMYLPVFGSLIGLTTLTKSFPEPALAALWLTLAFLLTFAIVT